MFQSLAKFNRSIFSLSLSLPRNIFLAFLFTTAGLLTGSLSMATLPPGTTLTCVTEFPTTSFIGEINGDYFKVLMVHHNGTKYMPVSSGLITPNDLPLVQKKAELLKTLGDQREVLFARENCTINQDKTIYCIGGKSFETESGKKVQVVSLNTAFINTKTMGYSFEQVSVSLDFKIDGQDADITMNYELFECGLATK